LIALHVDIVDRVVAWRSIQTQSSSLTAGGLHHLLGLIDGAPGGDGRQRVLSLTDAGRERVNDAIGYWEQAQERVMGVLGHQRWKDLVTSVRAASMLLGT
jgi:hypothetical protein